MEYRYALTILFSKSGPNDSESICSRSAPVRAVPNLAFIVDWNSSTDLYTRPGARADTGCGNQWESYRHCTGGQFDPDVDHQQCRERRLKWHDGRIEWVASGVAYNVNHISHYGSQFDGRD